MVTTNTKPVVHTQQIERIKVFNSKILYDRRRQQERNNRTTKQSKTNEQNGNI